MKDGKLIPNTFQHPNAYIDWLAYYLTPEEEKVLNKAIREILGWSGRIESRQARIALSIFEHGKISKETGEQLCLGCGLGINAIRKALDGLDKHKILVKIGKATNDGQMYAIQDNYQLVDLVGLKARRAKWDKQSAKRTAQATLALAEKRKLAAQGGIVAQQAGVSSDDRLGVSSDDNKETQKKPKIETQISTPSGGEQFLTETENNLLFAVMDFHSCDEKTATSHMDRQERKTKEQQKRSLRQVAGDNVLDGAMLAIENASDQSWTMPEQAGGEDGWESAADAFCCLQGLMLSDMPPKSQEHWPRKLQSIADIAQASPQQMVDAIREMPNVDGISFKVPGYTTPYKRSFEDDVIMVMTKIATGQIVPKGQKSNGWSTSL